MLTGLNRILDAARDRPDDIINTALETVRRHFRMDVAYLSEIVGDRTVFRAVSAPGFEAMIKPGDSMPLEAVYCQRIINGDFPNMIPDTDLEPGLQDYAITRSLPIGSHVSLPVRRDDGGVYGMFCCLARTPRPDLNLRDLEVMQLFSDVASTQVNKSLRQRSERQDKEDRIAAVIQSSGFVMHYQPILRLADMQLAGLESLCRFSADPPRSPDLWFGEAAELGLGVELELAAIAAALAALPTLPPDCYLSVNAGPATVADGRLGAVLTGRDGHRLVVEVTEHAAVTDQARFDAELFKLRMMGVRLAVDDAGAGYSGLQHIVRLQPDIVKLDMSLTRHVDRDPIRRSLAAALVAFGRETGAAIVAEGIETQAEAETMRQIGIRFGQGYLFARPMPLEAVHGTILAQPHVA